MQYMLKFHELLLSIYHINNGNEKSLDIFPRYILIREKCLNTCIGS